MDMPRMKFEPVNPEEETLLHPKEMHPDPEENPEPEALTHGQAAPSHDLTVDDLQDVFRKLTPRAVWRADFARV